MNKMKYAILIVIIAAVTVSLPSCKSINGDKTPKAEMTISQKPFGMTRNGEAVEVYTLDNGLGIKAQIMTYGGVMVSLSVPGREGLSENILLGFDDYKSYEDKSPCFGALVGRVVNRIADAKFTLDGKEYNIGRNCGRHSIHGGFIGFDKVVWQAESFQDGKSVGLKLHYVSKDGEEGFPGNLDVIVKYIINDKNELIFDYEATTDKATPVNLSQHNYYNFNGGQSDILSYELRVNSNSITPVNSDGLPTGEIMPVKGTPFDFTGATVIGRGINADNEQIKNGGGYDHNWILNKKKAGEVSLAADVYDPATGRGMEVYTDQPAVQIYCGNFLDGKLTGHNGYVYGRRYGLCLETQHYPDSPNHSEFPSTILQPGEVYKTKTIHKFYVR